MDKIKLYKYQDEAVQNAVEMIRERGNSLIVAGTGAGKTIMMAAAIGRFFYGFYAVNKRNPHILVLVHRTEIHAQNHEKFSRVCPGIPTSEVTATRKSLHGYIHFGMVQTVANLLDDFAQANSYFDMIVIDEAHHAKASTYEAIINWNKQGKPNAALLGVTATPNRGDKLPLVHLFDNYNQITTRFLIDSHYLVRPRFVDVSPVFNTDKGAEKGHLSKNCKADILGRELLSKLCRDYLREKEDGKSIIFAPSHDFCIAIFNELTAMGRSPAYLSLGLDDMTRREELERFENGDCNELINVDICTEGYDFPALRNIVDFDTNGTHGQWVQKVGRALRTAPGKTGCTIIDFGGNIDMYPEGVETDVNLDGVVKKPKGEHLSETDFFRGHKERMTYDYKTLDSQHCTPYNPPDGFETVLDADCGIVFVACGEVKDCIIVAKENEYVSFLGDKTNLLRTVKGSFEQCAECGTAWLDSMSKSPNKPISKLQVQLLAPEYATNAMDWYGANCCICWKTWRSEVLRLLSLIHEGSNTNDIRSKDNWI